MIHHVTAQRGAQHLRLLVGFTGLGLVGDGVPCRVRRLLRSLWHDGLVDLARDLGVPSGLLQIRRRKVQQQTPRQRLPVLSNFRSLS